ncbi:MAG: hypothetical protein AB7E61_07050 [Acholeplasmataceae bacterium]
MKIKKRILKIGVMLVMFFSLFLVTSCKSERVQITYKIYTYNEEIGYVLKDEQVWYVNQGDYLDHDIDLPSLLSTQQFIFWYKEKDINSEKWDFNSYPINIDIVAYGFIISKL